MNAPSSFDAALAFAADLIRIPGPPGQEEAVARRVVDEAERLGFDDVWIDEVGNVIGRIRGRGETPPVMLSCHLDVVDAGDASEWRYPPFGGVIEGGFLHGRGAMDIKGPLALQTHAAAAFIGDRPPGDLVIAHTVLEERGGWGMAHLMEAGEVRPGAVIIGESTGGDVCIGHRGRSEIVITVKGRAGHASAPADAVSALDGVGPVLDAVRTFAAALDVEDPVLGPASLVATDIVATPATRNVIPDRAEITVDWRTIPRLDGERARAALEAHLRSSVDLAPGLTLGVDHAVEPQRTWTGRERDWPMFGPGFLVPPDHPIPTAAAAAVEQATGRRPAVRPWRFATDGRHTCGHHGVPTIGYAPGHEGHAHTNTERLSLAEARLAFDAYPSVIRAVFETLR